MLVGKVTSKYLAFEFHSQEVILPALFVLLPLTKVEIKSLFPEVVCRKSKRAVSWLPPDVTFFYRKCAFELWSYLALFT